MAYSRFGADLRIARDLRLTEELIVASLGRRLGDRFGVSVVAGAILGGRIEDDAGAVHDVGAGWIASLQGSARLLGQDGWRPFVTGSLALAASSTDTTPGAGGPTSSLFATDARASLAVGWTVAGRVTPFVALRGFAGPVQWAEDTGTDRHHYQAAVGLDVALPAHLRLSCEWAPIGEQAVTVGIRFAFGGGPPPARPRTAPPAIALALALALALAGE